MQRIHLRNSAAWLGLAFATTLAASSRAQTAPGDEIYEDRSQEKRRAELYEEGVALANQGKWSEAAEKFRTVVALKESARSLFTLGQAEEKLDHIATARRLYERAKQAAESSRDLPVSAESSAALTRTSTLVPALKVEMPQAIPDVELRLDGRGLSRAEVESTIELDSGTHTVAATAPGRVAFSTQVSLGDGRTTTVLVSLPPLSMPAPTPSSSPQTIPHVAVTVPESKAIAPLTTAAPANHTWLGVALSTVGVVGGAVGAGLIYSSGLDAERARTAYAARDQLAYSSTIDAANMKQWMAGTAIGIGSVALGVGIYLVATSRSSTLALRSAGGLPMIVW